MGYIGFAKPVLMKANPITQLSYIGFAKPTLMKGIPTGLHRIGKAFTFER